MRYKKLTPITFSYSSDEDQEFAYAFGEDQELVNAFGAAGLLADVFDLEACYFLITAEIRLYSDGEIFSADIKHVMIDPHENQKTDQHYDLKPLLRDEVVKDLAHFMIERYEAWRAEDDESDVEYDSFKDTLSETIAKAMKL